MSVSQHVTSYPIVQDTISTVKSNSYGQKGIDLTTDGYNKFVAPVVPYAERPYGYVAPYVAKADSLASDTLTKVIDNNFPIIKEDTQKIKGTILDFAYFPFRVVGDGKNYIFGTYDSEYKKCGGDGVVAGSKAMITTSMVVTSDTFSWLSSFLSQKTEESKDFASAKYQQAGIYAKDAKSYTNEKSGQALNYAHDKSEHAKSYTNEKSGQALNYAHDKSEHAKQMAYEKSDQANNYANQKADEAKDAGRKAKKTADVCLCTTSTSDDANANQDFL